MGESRSTGYRFGKEAIRSRFGPPASPHSEESLDIDSSLDPPILLPWIGERDRACAMLRERRDQATPCKRFPRSSSPAGWNCIRIGETNHSRLTYTSSSSLSLFPLSPLPSPLRSFHPLQLSLPAPSFQRPKLHTHSYHGYGHLPLGLCLLSLSYDHWRRGELQRRPLQLLWYMPTM